MATSLARFDCESSPALEAGLRRLREEDFLGQLLSRSGPAAELATEAGDVKLDWIDQMAWALEHPELLTELEELALGLEEDGVRHLVWSGMGGSVQTVRSLVEAGLLADAAVRVHPLDSTDPAALNVLLREISGGGLAQTMLLAVSMGLTSEEPITHLEWFTGLCAERGVKPRTAVMTLPGSYLEQAAAGARKLPVQLNGESHIAGRMSAPTTRVFLLPAALALRSRGGLRAVLERCQAEFRLTPDLAAAERARLVDEDPFLRLAAWLSAEMDAGRDRVVLDADVVGLALAPWVEQVVEESLGKGGRGLRIFPAQQLQHLGQISVLGIGGSRSVRLDLAWDPAAATVDRLARSARFFAGWDLAVAAVGYLQGIQFAGQPAVEAYKRYARELREGDGPLPYPREQVIGDAGVAIAYGALGAAGVDLARLDHAADPAAALAGAVGSLRDRRRLGYLDITLNGQPSGQLWEELCRAGLELANRTLGIPVKLRSGPRDYHSTEQSLVDGPDDVLSIRVLPLATEPVAAGRYDSRFLHAQALGTVFAMRDAGRPVLLVLLGPGGASRLPAVFARAGQLLPPSLAAG